MGSSPPPSGLDEWFRAFVERIERLLVKAGLRRAELPQFAPEDEEERRRAEEAQFAEARRQASFRRMDAIDRRRSGEPPRQRVRSTTVTEAKPQITPLHTFWGQNGAAFLVGSVVALLTGAVTNVGGVVICCFLIGLGLYGMFGPYVGLRLPEPKAKTRLPWRIGFVLLLAIVVGAFFVASKPGSEAIGKVAVPWRPKPIPTVGRMPLQTRWPPTIAYGAIGSSSKHIAVDMGLINNVDGALQVSMYGKAVLRPVARDDNEEVAVLGNLRDAVHRDATAGGGAVVAIPALDGRMRVTIPGPHVSEERWLRVQQGQEYVYFYALMYVKMPNGDRFARTTCGIGSGLLVFQCPERADPPPQP